MIQTAIDWSLRNRYLAVTLFVAALIIMFSIAIGGHLRFIFFPRIQAVDGKGRSVEGTGLVRQHIDGIAGGAGHVRPGKLNRGG